MKMMKIETRNDGSITIEGYVNAVERKSKPLWGIHGKYLEKVEANTFTRSLERNPHVQMLLNHDSRRKLADTEEGTLQLREDSIGLYASATVLDKEVIEEYRAGNLKGWSFGFKDNDVNYSEKDGVQLRTLTDIDLFEVSLLTVEPAYIATSIQKRSEEFEIRSMSFECVIQEEEKQDKVEEEQEQEQRSEVPFFNADIVKVKAFILKNKQ